MTCRETIMREAGHRYVFLVDVRLTIVGRGLSVVMDEAVIKVANSVVGEEGVRTQDVMPMLLLRRII